MKKGHCFENMKIKELFCMFVGVRSQDPWGNLKIYSLESLSRYLGTPSMIKGKFYNENNVLIKDFLLPFNF